MTFELKILYHNLSLLIFNPHLSWRLTGTRNINFTEGNKGNEALSIALRLKLGYLRYLLLKLNRYNTARLNSHELFRLPASAEKDLKNVLEYTLSISSCKSYTTEHLSSEAVMHKLLITGGAGFIGSSLVRFLLEHDPEVEIINLDKLTYSGNLGNLQGVLGHPRHLFVKGDIADPELVRELMKEHCIQGVMNLAAETHVDRSIHDSAVFVETNVRGTQNLLAQALDCGVERFLQISTDEVYGELGSEGRFHEETPLHPNSPYSASKAGADHLVQAARHTYGMNTVITRCSNNYGPRQFPEKMIPLMINNARRGERLPVYGDGLNVRDWIHVHDHCRALWQVYCEASAGEVYNIGGDNERTNLEVVRTILRILDQPESLISLVKDRPGHDRRYAIDTGKIKSRLGWRPSIGFEQGLVDTVNWYCQNQEWLDEVVSGDYELYYQQMYGDRSQPSHGTAE